MKLFLLLKQFVRKFTESTIYSWYKSNFLNFWWECRIWKIIRSQHGLRLISLSKAPGITIIHHSQGVLRTNCHWYLGWVTSSHLFHCLEVSNFSTGQCKEFDSYPPCFIRWLKWIGCKLIHFKTSSYHIFSKFVWRISASARATVMKMQNNFLAAASAEFTYFFG